MTEAECDRINNSIDGLAKTVGALQLDLSNRMTKLEQHVANEGALCPFRESISRSSNNLARIDLAAARLDHVEDKIHALELQFAKAGIISGAAGGGVFSAVGVIVFAVGKAAGWW